ncbi:MAG: hypothetical protein JSR37_00975 [Verrucomicrobia bacterium]|nr:hypothetical protein [Verrucomicrobiota bacterium]MBS0637944.1 hypothetical protein [Verrucomicrobiota bacterium]
MDVGARFPLPGEPTVIPAVPTVPSSPGASPGAALSQVEAANKLEVVPPVVFAPIPNSRATAQAAMLLENSNIAPELTMLYQEPRTEIRDEIAPLVHGVVRLINETTIKPVTVTNSKELVQAAVQNEKVSTITANRLLQDLDSTIALREQPKILKDVERLAHDMAKITLAMLELPCEFYLEHASSDVQSLAAKLKPCITEQGTKYENAERQLLNKAEVFVVVSLMKLSLSPNGAEFVKSLNDTLSKNDHQIDLQIRKRVGPSSLLAFHARSQLACIVINQKPPEIIKYSDDKVAQEIGQARNRNSGYFSPNVGSSSLLGFPVWPKNSIDTMTDEGRHAMEELLHSMTAEEAFGRIVLGGISFAKDAQMFYTPAHIEVSHELIHVLNNSLGVNAQNVEMTSRNRNIWKDAEERVAIAGCQGVGHSENSLGEDYKLKQRYGHAGLPISAFSNQELLDKTARELSGLDDVHNE